MVMFRKILILFILQFVFFTGKAFASHLYPEKYYQNIWCEKWGGVAEYRLSDKTRVDCVTKTYVAEFDFAPKWAEAVGQSLYYSKMTGKKPAIILIIEDEGDFVYFNRAKVLADDNDIALWYMKKPEKQRKAPAGKSGNLKIAYDGIYISFSDIEKLITSVLKFIESFL